MTKEQIIVTILVAAIGVIGTSIASVFGFLPFWLKRRDEKDEEALRAMISKMIGEADDKLRGEFRSGLDEREHTGKERFDTHAESIREINEQIKLNNKQITELTELSKTQLQNQVGFTESLTALNKMVKISVESQRNSNYDRLLLVTTKILKSGKMTFSDKTNLIQLYTSWKEMGGIDPEMDTKYEECIKFKPVLDEG